MAISRRQARRERPLHAITGEQLVSRYAAGERDFSYVQLNGANLAGIRLTDVTFLGGSLREADFRGAHLAYVQLKAADLRGACFSSASINGSDLIGANFERADLCRADLTGSHLGSADCTQAKMKSTWFNNVTLSQAVFKGAILSGAHLSHAHFYDLDVGPFCGTDDLEHGAPSSIDCRTVMKSYLHSGLRLFMTACGVPEIFATYMIDCARASGEPLLRSLMQSTFISYGGPDEAFARKLYEVLRAHRVIVFFFPETAMVGGRIDDEVFRRIQEHDRVLLICSRDSLNRPGVLNEIQETLDREARDGGATYLLPIMLDDYVLTGWRKSHPELAERIGRRIIGDFRGTKRSKRTFDAAVARVIDALKTKRVI